MLQHLLDAKGITLTQIAQETGMDAATLEAVLAGTQHLTREQIGTFAHYFQVSPSVFAFGA